MKIFHVTFRTPGGMNRPKAKLNSQVLMAATLGPRLNGPGFRGITQAMGEGVGNLQEQRWLDYFPIYWITGRVTAFNQWHYDSMTWVCSRLLEHDLR